MSAVRLRRATLGDLPTVVGLVRSESLPEDLELHLANFLVAECDGNIFGVIGPELLGYRALLRSLVVDRDWRNTGVGTSLATEAIRQVRCDRKGS
jgi:N-acetylglutamate synthase-like GNAT family acetyltransferase